MRAIVPLLASIVALCMAVGAGDLAHAAWPHDPLFNLTVCELYAEPDLPHLVSDGCGGAIVAWDDLRSGTEDVYAQHVLASGLVDPAWPVDGLAVCTATSRQRMSQLVSDGAGGAIVTWMDHRGSSVRIYAQRVRSTGVVDPAWPVDGRALSASTQNQSDPQIASDGAGGAIVVWSQSSPFASCAQHVRADGSLDPAWNPNGETIISGGGFPRALADGAGGVIAVASVTGGVRVGRLSASGDPLPGNWATGVLVYTGAGSGPRLCPDGAGGVLVAWYDKSGTPELLRAQHVQASGVVDPAWPANGRLLCSTTIDIAAPVMVPDGVGGAIVAWRDARSTIWDIYAQRVLASGALDPAWPVNGLLVATGPGGRSGPRMVSDDAGGAFLCWDDLRASDQAVYIQHLLPSGQHDAAWPLYGKALTIEPACWEPDLVADGRDGILVAWAHYRSSARWAVEAQRVARLGKLGAPEPIIAWVRDVPNDQGGHVSLSWDASYLDGAGDPDLAYYDVMRGADSAWELLGSVPALHYVSNYGYIAVTTTDSSAGGNPLTRFKVVARNAAGTAYWTSMPDSGYSVDNLAPLAPNPLPVEQVAGGTRLRWQANGEPDLAGYRIYRGLTAEFVPGPDCLEAVVTEPSYLDASVEASYFKVSAFDTHGNEGPAALIASPGSAMGSGTAMPGGPSLAAARPNPAAGTTVLSFMLPREMVVRLSLFDASGRRVRTLAEGSWSAGEHSVRWDLSNDDGRPLSAGLYFALLEVEGRLLGQRIVATR